MPQRVTIHDVARHAGVSHQTVSRVINDHPRVADETRLRVQQTIVQLDFRPSLRARGLKARHSGLLGIVTHGTERYDPYPLVQHIERHARAHGYDVLLITLREHGEENLRDAGARLQQFGVDGLLVVAGCDAPGVAWRMSMPMPVVLVMPTDGSAHATVGIDQVQGAVLALEHLIHLGHRTIAHLDGPCGWNEADLRYRGYVQTMMRHGLYTLPRLHGDGSPGSAHRAVRRALDAGTFFTALTVASAPMALGACSALRTIRSAGGIGRGHGRQP